MGLVDVVRPDATAARTASTRLGFDNPFALFGLYGIAAGSYVFVAFQLTFAVITAALISGAIADRAKFSAWLVFLAALGHRSSYFPIAHMVWAVGFLGDRGRPLGTWIADRAAKIAPRLRGRHGRPHQRRYCRPGSSR